MSAYANHDWKSERVDLSYDEAAKTVTGNFTVTDETYPTIWCLKGIQINSVVYSSSIEPEANFQFEVVNENFDTKSPVIESITLDKNGQFVKPGDMVTITVKISEEHPSENVFVHFKPQVTNVSVSQGVSLKYDAATSSYTGSITITEDTYPCEWALTELHIHDENNNWTYLSEFRQDYKELLPWYYMVKSKDTYQEDYKEVTFNFYGFTASRKTGAF